MSVVQLEFFKSVEECELDHLRETIETVKQSSDKVRRGMYAKLNEIAKENVDLKARLEIIERNICRGN
jgi:hypothetical protein